MKQPFFKRKIGLGLYIGTVILLIVLAELFAWAVWHQLNEGKLIGPKGKILLSWAKFPAAFFEKEEAKHPLVVAVMNADISRTSNDSGYILTSCYEDSYKQTVIKLISLSNFQSLHTWIPDLRAIANSQRTASDYLKEDALQKDHFRTQHPLLMPDTGIIIKGEYGMYKVDKNSKIIWYTPGLFHHSMEEDATGDIWTSSILTQQTQDANLYPELRDETLTKVSKEGKILFEKSVITILIENGYKYLVFGVGAYEKDPVHINDIQPALNDTKYWKQGDLLVSARNISTVFLYRPSTNKVIWLKTGPWMNQHDVSFIDSTSIGIFGNNMVRTQKQFKMINPNNNFYVYHFNFDSVSTPYNALFVNNKIATASEGRTLVLSNGDLFVEETNKGRLLRGNNQKVQWSYYDMVDNNHAATMGWTRYYNRNPLSSK